MGHLDTPTLVEYWTLVNAINVLDMHMTLVRETEKTHI